jgi:hypothetical protein
MSPCSKTLGRRWVLCTPDVCVRGAEPEVFRNNSPGADPSTLRLVEHGTTWWTASYQQATWRRGYVLWCLKKTACSCFSLLVSRLLELDATGHWQDRTCCRAGNTTETSIGLKRYSESLVLWTCPSSVSLSSKETQLVHWLRLTLSKRPDRVSPSPFTWTWKHPVSETSCFVVIYNSGRWTKSINPMILNVYTVVRTLYVLPKRHVKAFMTYMKFDRCHFYSSTSIATVIVINSFCMLQNRFWSRQLILPLRQRFL